MCASFNQNTMSMKIKGTKNPSPCTLQVLEATTQS